MTFSQGGGDGGGMLGGGGGGAGTTGAGGGGGGAGRRAVVFVEIMLYTEPSLSQTTATYSVGVVWVMLKTLFLTKSVRVFDMSLSVADGFLFVKEKYVDVAPCEVVVWKYSDV
jgi:hypothetical protein